MTTVHRINTKYLSRYSTVFTQVIGSKKARLGLAFVGMNRNVHELIHAHEQD